MVGSLRPHRRGVRILTIDDLPGWPFALPFVLYGFAWIVGLGDLIWPLCAAVMAVILARTRGVRVPPWFGLWLLFIAWVMGSVVAIDSVGRLIGFSYRLSLYLAATVMALYAFNAVRSVSVRYICGVLVLFLATMTVFGYVAMVFPLGTIRTPLAMILPGGLQQNELVQDMVVRRLTQFNPASWEQTVPRPSAPFLYTNTWGNVYSLVWPLAAFYGWREKCAWRGKAALGVVVVSLVPALLTLNRGMFFGLGVVALFVMARLAWAGRVGLGAAVLVGSLGIGLVVMVSPVGALLVQRLASGSSTEDRGSLYLDTFEASLRAPIFGYGAPRPAAEPWLPSLGTQGQLWTVMFSHGLPALVLFMAWFGVAALVAWRASTMVATVLGAVVAATIVESVFYGMMTGLNISLLAAVMVFRPRWGLAAVSREARNNERSPQGSPLASLSRATE